jgi:hypothetical protein
MPSLNRKTISTCFVFLIATASVNAQNMMTRNYPSASSDGPINRGDFNEDGIPDVIFQTFTGVTVALGTPQGALGTLKSSNGSVSGGAGDLAVAKFTSSGHLDVAVTHLDGSASGPSTIDILLGHGDGTFDVGQVLVLPGGGTANSLTSSDFNADGNSDLAVLVANTVYIFRGNGNGTFSAPTAITTSLKESSFLFKIRVGDFDADGRPDLALKDATQVAVLFNNGNLTFHQTNILTNTMFVNDITPSDVNQDGFTDLLIALQGDCPPTGPCQGGFSVFTSAGKSRGFQLAFRRAPDFTIDAPFELTAVDVDGDGINDIVGVTSVAKPFLFVAKGFPNGTFSNTLTTYLLGDHGGVTHLVSVDLNRDGRPDFVSLAGLTTSLNAVPRAPCANRTQSPSVTVCLPSENAYVHSPLRVLAHTTDTAHAVKSLQVYVDGKLLKAVTAKSLDAQISLPLGAHFMVVKASDTSGASFRTTRHVQVYSGLAGQVCSTARQALTVCAPSQNAGVVSPVRVFAAAYLDAVLTSFQIYLDSKLIYKDASANYVDRSFSVPKGTHTFTIKTYDASGRKLAQSRVVTVH